MKKVKSNNKLVVRKTTVTHLNDGEMNNLKGGSIMTPTTSTIITTTTISTIQTK